jgi:hypothetical protein
MRTRLTLAGGREVREAIKHVFKGGPYDKHTLTPRFRGEPYTYDGITVVQTDKDGKVTRALYVFDKVSRGSRVMRFEGLR